MRALVTRPLEDAETTANLLRQRGIEPVIEPLMVVVQEPGISLDLEGVQGFMVTSANGVRALAQTTARRDLPVWAVGDATASLAHQLGFEQVASANGDVSSLAWLVRDRVLPTAGRLIHVAGTEVAGDLAGELEHMGYQVTRAVVYHTEALKQLRPEIVQHLVRGEIDLALFFSPRTAKIFVDLVAAATQNTALEKVTAIALSQGVAQKLRPIPWHRIVVAEHPTQADLFAALDRTLFRAD